MTRSTTRTDAPRAYYNEHDPFAAAWRRELIKAGHIAPGDVDERSIEDVCPDDLAGYVQCHFFAGIGVWSHALRLAGWPDHRAIWTGSCPCQPFSAAGKGAGFDDERHLWPAFFDLIQQCNPPVVVGEQVASKDGLAWLDLVSADVEGSGRAFAAADLCAAGFGAPHIRQRSYWVAHAADAGRQLLPREGRRGLLIEAPRQAEREQQFSGHCASVGGMDDADGARHVRTIGNSEGDPRDEARLRVPRAGREEGGMGKSFGARAKAGISEQVERQGRHADVYDDGRDQLLRPDEGRPTHGIGHNGAPSTNGFWFDADWLGCRDGKWRPVEPGTFPLAHGAANRVGRLRGYGNAIVGPVAQGFIEAVMASEL